jgi:outer membrane biosynthesis protein TonB
MKQQEVFKKIGIIISEINDQYNYLKGEGENLNDLELELFVANSHFLAEHAEVLRKLNSQNLHEDKPEPKTTEKYFEPVVQQVKHEPEPEPQKPSKPVEVEITNSDDKPVPHIDLAANGADDDFSVMRREPDVIKHELILDESQDWDEDDDRGFEIDEATEIEPEEKEVAPKPEEKEVIPEPEIKKTEPVRETPAPAPEVKKEVPPVIKEVHPPAPVEHKKEPESEEPLTINQMMSAQLNKTSKASEHLHGQQPIADLKQAITLNDKLLYIKDLFNGYNLAYSEAIDILNRFSAFEEANDFLQKNYAVKNQWETKQTTVDKFYALLRRRYA